MYQSVQQRVKTRDITHYQPTKIQVAIAVLLLGVKAVELKIKGAKDSLLCALVPKINM